MDLHACVWLYRCTSGIGTVGGLPLKTDPASGQTAQDGHREGHQNLQKQALPGFTW